MEQTVCFERQAFKIQTPWNYPEENIEHTEHGECLQLHTLVVYFTAYLFGFIEK
jgi:hypothetical protein